jgi:hypothetical protein
MTGLVASKILLILHAAGAVVLIGAATHNGLLALAQLRGRPCRPRLRQLYGRVVLWAYLFTFAIGLIIYPAFRVRVRAALLDHQYPLATAFFEIKEHWLAIGLLVLACHALMSRRVRIERPSVEATLYGVLGIALMVIVWMAMLTGLTLTAIEAV